MTRWFPSADDIDAIHARVVADDPVDRRHPNLMPGGRSRVEHAVATCRPAADASEAELLQSAACILGSINRAHPYDAGNKRTALVTAMTVLRANGWVLSPPPEESRRFMLDMRERDVPGSEIEAWVRKWSRKDKV